MLAIFAVVDTILQTLLTIDIYLSEHYLLTLHFIFIVLNLHIQYYWYTQSLSLITYEILTTN